MKSFALIGSAHIVQLLCSLLGTVLVFRSLDPADVGTVVSIVAYNTVLIIPLSSGFAKVYSALLVEPDSARRVAKMYWVGSASIMLLSPFLVALTALLYGDPIYALLAGLLGMMGVHKMNLRHAEDKGSFARIGIVRIGVGLALLGIKALAALLFNPYLFAASFVVEQALYLLLLPARHVIGPLSLLRDGVEAIRLPQLRSVAKLLPTEFAAGISLKFPLLMFGALSMPEAAALYNAATRLPEAFNGLVIALFASIRPKAYREAAETIPARFPYRSTHRFVQLILWLIVMAMIVVPVLMPLLFGEFYRQAQLGAGLYFLVSIPILMGIVQEVWMVSSRLFRLSAVRLFLGMVTSILATSALFPLLGLEGAILGVFLGAAVQAILSNLVTERLRIAYVYQMRLLRNAFWPFGRQ